MNLKNIEYLKIIPFILNLRLLSLRNITFLQLDWRTLSNNSSKDNRILVKRHICIQLLRKLFQTVNHKSKLISKK